MPFAAAANWPAACSCSIAAAAGLGAVAAFRACVCAWDDECFLPHGSCQFGDILLSRVTAPCRLEVQKEHTERHGDLANWMPGAGYQMRLNSTSVSVGKQSMAMRLYDSLGIDAPSLTGSESFNGAGCFQSILHSSKAATPCSGSSSRSSLRLSLPC